MNDGVVSYLPVSPVQLLRERVVSAIEHIEFYRTLYQPFGSVPHQDCFMEWFRQLPIIHKSQLQAAGLSALLNSQYDQSELIRKPTSGSTGIPFTIFLHDTVSNFRKWRFLRPYQRFVNEPSTGLVFIFPWDFLARTPKERKTVADDRHAPTGRSDGDRPSERNTISVGPEIRRSFSSVPKKTKGTKKSAQEAADLREQTPILNRPFTVNSWLPLERLFETLNELNPAALIGFASNLAALARWMLQEKRRLPSIRQIWTTSEVLSPEGADAIRAAMGCEPLAIYASNEFGFMAWQAENSGPLYFESDRLLLETVKRDGLEPAAIGELSRIVVSDLLNDTMPLIRYDIGDIARACEPIQATNDLRCDIVSDLQGKEADMLQPPDGRTVTTFHVLGAIKDHLPNSQYRFIEAAPDQYILQYSPGVGFSPDNIEVVISVLQEILGSDVEIVAHQVDSITREPSGKLRPLINLCNVSEGKRRALAKQLGILPLLPVPSRSTAISIVRKALTAALHCHDFNGKLCEEKELYADLAIDSLHFVHLVHGLERELDRQIDDEDLMDTDLVTVGDLVTFVQDRLPE